MVVRDDGGVFIGAKQRMHHSPQEILAAAPDYVALACGVKVHHPHPLARGLNLRTIAEAAGTLRMPGIPGPKAGTGITTGDFGRAIAAGVAQVVAVRFETVATHRRFVSVIPVPNFRAASVPTADTEIRLEPLSENGEIRAAHFTIESGAGQVWLKSYVRNLLISRHAVINDDMGLVRAMVASTGASGARTEAELVVQALENPPALDDGDPAFGAQFGNVLADAFSESALDEAMGLLRTQRLANGGLADLELRHLVVGASFELTAHKAVHQAGLSERVQVTAMAGLPAGRWYALAAPEAAPTIAVLQLAGIDIDDDTMRVPVRIDPVAHKPNDLEGLALRATADLAAALVSRIGIVRGGTDPQP